MNLRNRLIAVSAALVLLHLSGCKATSLPAALGHATTKPASTGPRVAAYLSAAYRPHVFAGPNGTSLNYRLLSPEKIESGRKYPLVVLLHGSGERGDDNLLQLVHGAAGFYDIRDSHPAFVVVPQCPKLKWWTGPNKLRQAERVAYPPNTPPPFDALRALLGQLQAELPIDRTRVYVTGLSMGGYGTFDLVAQMPNTFAAAMPICGGGEAALAEQYRGTAVWIFHGDSDKSVPVGRSRIMFEALKSAGVDVRYTEYPGVGHDSWTPTYSDRQVMDWLFSQLRRAQN